MTRNQLAAAIKQCSLLYGEFDLRSGAKSDYYFDKYMFESDPKLLREITNAMSHLIPVEAGILAGLEMGGIPIVTMLSQITSLPCVFIRKEAKKHGTCKYAEGPSLVDRNVILIEDIVSSGGALIDAVEALRKDNIYPRTAICVIDRETGGEDRLSKMGIELISLFKMSEI